MLTNRYRKTIAKLVLALVVILALLATALYLQGPRIRKVQINGGQGFSALSQGSTIDLIFDRTLDPGDYKSLISFEPQVDFSAVTFGHNITITLNENLSSAVTYKLTVKPEVRDSSARKMRETYVRTVTTPSAKFAYVERNYPLAEGDLDPNDKVILGELSSVKPRPIFEAVQIRSITANSRYVVVVVRQESKDELNIIDLTNMSVRKYDIAINARISSMALGAYSNYLLYAIMPDFEAVSTEFFQQVANNTYSLDLTTLTQTELTDVSGKILKSQSITMDSKSQIALVGDPLLTYHFISPYNDFEPVQVGSHDAEFGFDNKDSKVIFRDDIGFSLYDIKAAETSQLPLKVSGYVQSVLSTSNTKFVSSLNYITGESNGVIYRLDDWDAKPQSVWRDDDGNESTLREFVPSYDNLHLAVQLNGDFCKFDAYGINSQCEDSSISIYDINKRQDVSSFRGIDLLWLP